MLIEQLQMLDSMDGIKWVSLTIALLLFGAWFYVQNKHFDYRAESPSRSDYITLLRAARIRSLIINVMLWGCFLAFLQYEFAIDVNLSTQKATQQIKKDAAIAVAPQMPVEQSVSPIRVDAIPNPNPPITEEAIVPERDTSEQKLDALKERYEDVFVSYLYLKRCEKAGNADYPAIMKAFQDEVKDMSYDPSLFQSVYEAAEGSYSAIYSESACDDATLLPVLERFKSWLDEATGTESNDVGNGDVATN